LLDLTKFSRIRKLFVLRNNERKSGIAKRSFKHVTLKENGAQQFPMYRLDFLVRFLSRKNEQKKKYSVY
jgi:hypothetical protein